MAAAGARLQELRVSQKDQLLHAEQEAEEVVLGLAEVLRAVQGPVQLALRRAVLALDAAAGVLGVAPAVELVLHDVRQPRVEGQAADARGEGGAVGAQALAEEGDPDLGGGGGGGAVGERPEGPAPGQAGIPGGAGGEEEGGAEGEVEAEEEGHGGGPGGAEAGAGAGAGAGHGRAPAMEGEEHHRPPPPGVAGPLAPACPPRTLGPLYPQLPLPPTSLSLSLSRFRSFGASTISRPPRELHLSHQPGWLEQNLSIYLSLSLSLSLSLCRGPPTHRCN